MVVFNIKKVMSYDVNIEVRVYSSVSAMNKGIKRLDYKDVTYCQASVNPSTFINTSNNKKIHFIRVFLCLGHLGMEIITHESVHIATTILRNANKSIRLSSQVDNNEERLAYTIGRVGRLLVLNLTELGYYK